MSTSLADRGLASFLRDLASKAPTPGGGSVAALTGALAAGLLSMVCNLTIGKEKYREVEAEVERLLGRSEELRQRLTSLIDEDVAAYGALSAAYRLPRETEQEKSARSTAIQQALREATAVPLAIAEACVALLDLCEPAARVGNVAAVSDVGVAALLAEAGLRSAHLNVLINLAAIKDADFVARAEVQMDSLLQGKSAAAAAVLSWVEKLIRGEKTG